MSLDSTWKFENTYTTLPSVFYTETQPNPVSEPSLLLYNKKLAAQMGLAHFDNESEYLASVLSGNHVPKGTTSIAQAYAGHQFGGFTMLGDGRAVLIGELITPLQQRVDIQLKGSGETRYSRNGDGRSTLYSMLREYIISEAIAALNIKTTRSLAVVKSDDPVYRQKIHTTGILTRVAESHIRVGSFEFAVRTGDPNSIKELFEYTAKRHYPHVFKTNNPALSFLKEVIAAQINLVNDWLKVGFIHGVMNTDNMSICGETIDYGPCAFMNAYDPQTVFSSIDRQKRYAYENQAGIAKWNLMRFAETILNLIDPDPKKAVELAQVEFDKFEDDFNAIRTKNFLAKLGITQEEKGDAALLNTLLQWMTDNKADFTNTFRGLSESHLHEDTVFKNDAFLAWKNTWQKRVNTIDKHQEVLAQNNPSIIPRNHLVEDALIAASEHDDIDSFNELLHNLQHPYNNCENAKYQNPPLSEAGYQTFCGT